MININETILEKINEKQSELLRSLEAGALRDLAIAKGGTGHLRKELTADEKARRKAKRKQARMSRKQNRKGA